MNKITPFLWFNNNAEDAANFYLSIFPNSKKLSELRAAVDIPSMPAGALLTIAIEIEGQQVTFINGGPAHQLSEAFSFTITCNSQAELDDYWQKFSGTPIACGWIKDNFGVCWQVVPHNITELVSHPKALVAMMKMIKLDIATLEAAAKE
ncbi:VOC family protein [Granulicella sp. 5B5]|uniref:VOC family protein n=1 Tax=Granulicella sp. 5B5 TaxID=1617967 RepID=UPI0015F4EF75|nr:VOC family protein [Granulicella sp. 5B5]QMV19201.1 VOC family protein [Granulicella sp. 5B5]